MLLNCFAGCSYEDIIGALGVSKSELFPPDSEQRQVQSSGLQIVAEDDYVDEVEDFLFQVVRYEPKLFRQRCENSDGSWNWSVKDVRKVPYRLERIIKAKDEIQPDELKPTIFVVEGEKDVQTLESLDLLATYLAKSNP